MSSVVPVDIALDRDRELSVRWSDGRVCAYPLGLLRRHCPCAGCREERGRAAAGGLPIVQSPTAQSLMARARTVELVGRYALRLMWEDGHNTGIYDYELLRSLCPEGAPPPSAPTASG